MSYQATRIGNVDVNVNDPKELMVNTATGALLVDVSGTISFPDSVQVNPLGIDQVTPGANIVLAKPATSVKSMAVLTPAGTSKAVSGAGGLGLTIISTVAKVLLWASSSGVTMNYNAAATSSTVPVPTAATELDISAADLALLQLLGNSEITVNVIQFG